MVEIQRTVLWEPTGDITVTSWRILQFRYCTRSKNISELHASARWYLRSCRKDTDSPCCVLPQRLLVVTFFMTCVVMLKLSCFVFENGFMGDHYHVQNQAKVIPAKTFQ